jgi:hypothetical protein
MTASERVLLHRKKQREAGKKMVTIFLDEGLIKDLDEWMKKEGCFRNRDEAIAQILGNFFASLAPPFPHGKV